MGFVDVDGTGDVSRPWLKRLEVAANEFAKVPELALERPSSVDDLMENIFVGFDRDTFLRQIAVKDAAGTALELIIPALQVMTHKLSKA